MPCADTFAQPPSETGEIDTTAARKLKLRLAVATLAVAPTAFAYNDFSVRADCLDKVAHWGSSYSNPHDVRVDETGYESPFGDRRYLKAECRRALTAHRNNDHGDQMAEHEQRHDRRAAMPGKIVARPSFALPQPPRGILQCSCRQSTSRRNGRWAAASSR